jgi:hypothetical protein
MPVTGAHVRALLFASAIAFVGAGCAPAQGQAITFQDDFDDGGAAGRWTLFSHGGDYSADFAFDYGAIGIPPAPHADGTTIGLHLTVNSGDGTPATEAVSAYPTGQHFEGDYTLEFDLWLNYNNGPGGGVGSTEFATAGINHAGTRVCWANNPDSDGYWVGVTGEGGDADDYRVYRDATMLSVAVGGYAANSRNHTDMFYQALFPSPPFETQGAPGKQWIHVAVRQHGGVITWRLNDRLIATRLDATLTAGTIMIGYMDTYASIADPADENFVLFDNVRVNFPDCNDNGVPDADELAAGTSTDCNGTGVPDECEPIGDGDFDVDGDVDASDGAAFARCAAGPATGPSPPDPGCAPACLAAFDIVGTGTVDLADFAALQRRATTGPFPARPTGAPTGTQFMAEVAGVARAVRENRIVDEITGGNVPGFNRGFVPVGVSEMIGGRRVDATFYVLPDYLSIGRDDDFVRVPMTPIIAQPIADVFACLLPTRKMVDAVYEAASVKLAPSPISPTTTDITRATTFLRHHEAVEMQREGEPLGALIGGIKKDVVITPLLATHAGRVAIYGWHRLDGTPIQPLYLGHVDSYVDYSHGIRLVHERMLVDGVETNVADVLADPELHLLLSDEGVVTNPRY